jgi:hypothetical protein
MDRLMKDFREEGDPNKRLVRRGEVALRHIQRNHAAYQWEDYTGSLMTLRRPVHKSVPVRPCSRRLRLDFVIETVGKVPVI